MTQKSIDGKEKKTLRVPARSSSVQFAADFPSARMKHFAVGDLLDLRPQPMGGHTCLVASTATRDRSLNRQAQLGFLFQQLQVLR